MSLDWLDAANQLHARVKAMSWWDTLADLLIDLHQPRFLRGEQPVCSGCDRDDRSVGDAVWPCRTYTLTASVVLRTDDVEGLLESMRKALANRTPEPFHRPRRRAAGAS